MGETANGRTGETANATKWLDRMGQGFSPGLGSNRGRALKGRPSGNRVGPWFPQIQNLKKRDDIIRAEPEYSSVALSGRFFLRSYPGLKPG